MMQDRHDARMIQIADLHKTFGRGTANEVYALRGINLVIKKGDFVTIIGTNGSGKSTLLNAVGGSFLPDSGKILIEGRDVSRKMDFQRAPAVARVFQNPFMGTAPNMSLVENMHMAFLRGKRRTLKLGLNSEKAATYKEAVQQLEMQLDNRLENRIGTLSGGQRQALTLLMAVMNRPKVLLLDEHTAALDPKSAAQVIELTKRFVGRWKLTTLMVTHSMQQALDLGNRTIMMNKGEVIDDMDLKEKQRATVDDLLDMFAELRKAECLTDAMLEALRREYR